MQGGAGSWALTCGPLRNYNGEYASPYGDQRHRNEDWCGYGTHKVRPHACAVHQALPQRQCVLEERAVLTGQNNLEVTLQPV